MPAPRTSTDAIVRLDRRDAELRLARYRRTRDPVERGRLMLRFLPLARRLADRYRHTSESREDLMQVAVVGLIQAIDRFDATRGTAFTSFAVPTIVGELQRHLRDNTWPVHVPRDTRELADRLTPMGDELTAELGRSPTVAELAERLGRSVEQVLDARIALGCRTTAPLDAPPAAPRRHRPPAEPIDGGLARAEERLILEDLLATLSAREREMLRLRFCDGLLQQEIAAITDVSQPQVSRTLRKALKRLRAATGTGHEALKGR